MPLIRGRYQDYRSQILPGDVVAFSGSSHFSNIIRWATRSPVSHVGIVFETKVSFGGKAQKGRIIEIMEATGMRRHPETGEESAGVQRRRMSLKMQYYDGDIWWLPLSAESRRKFDFDSMANFLMRAEGKRYDSNSDVIAAAIDTLDSQFAGGISKNDENFTAFFCSELVSAGLEAAKVIHNVNSSEVTPFDLCAFKIFADKYYQLKGSSSTEIPNYNSVDPKGFGI